LEVTVAIPILQNFNVLPNGNLAEELPHTLFFLPINFNFDIYYFNIWRSL